MSRKYYMVEGEGDTWEAAAGYPANEAVHHSSAIGQGSTAVKALQNLMASVLAEMPIGVDPKAGLDLNAVLEVTRTGLNSLRVDNAFEMPVEGVTENGHHRFCICPKCRKKNAELNPK